MYGTGVNCTVECSPPDLPTQLVTRAMPTYAQNRFDHRALDGISPTFNDLVDAGGIQILERIAEAMYRFDEQVWEQRSRELLGDTTVGEEEQTEFSEDRKSFKEEIRRFKAGIRCLANPLAFRAFSLMNSTFRLLGGKGRDQWRLFQIVFIVSMRWCPPFRGNLKGVSSRHHHNRPWGGPKPQEEYAYGNAVYSSSGNIGREPWI
jgi:hypothetical protein